MVQSPTYHGCGKEEESHFCDVVVPVGVVRKEVDLLKDKTVLHGLHSNI
jgi:hypothetical protein